MAEEDAEPLAQQALADVGVPVAIRPERRLCVVHVQHAEAVAADAAVERVEHAVERRPLGHVAPRDEEVARVEAHAEPWMAVEPVVDRRQLVDRPSDRPARAGRVLHQEPRRVGAAVEHLRNGGHDTLEPLLEPRAEVRADVEDDGVGLDRAGRIDRRAHRRDALLVDRVVRRGEIDEVERVDDDRPDPDLLPSGPKRCEVSRIVLREPPGPWALREELHRVGADGGSVVERALDPTRAVAAEEHGPTLTGARVLGRVVSR